MSVNDQHRNALPTDYWLENFRLESVLGHGGFGLTYRAVDEDLQQVVAIKEYLPREVVLRDRDSTVVPVSESDRETFDWGLERFLDEARTLARFRHPNIVGVRRFLRANGTAYLVMDFCEGESLESVLTREGTLPPERLEAMLVPLLDALEALHAAGVTHRDIKPGNIYLREDDSPVLLDFGAARQALAQHSRSVTAMATPGYAAFEQYSTKGKQGPWTDIYGLGATLYRCVTGQRPPDASDRMLEDELVPAKHAASGLYPHLLLEQIDAALKIRPQERPQSIIDWRTQANLETVNGTASRSAPKTDGWDEWRNSHELGEQTFRGASPPARTGVGAVAEKSRGEKVAQPELDRRELRNEAEASRRSGSKPVLEDLFRFSGRRNRKSYILVGLAWVGFLVAVAVVFDTASVPEMEFGEEVIFLLLLAYVPLLVSGIAVSSQRLRDLGWSGWWVVGAIFLIGLVPYIGWLIYMPLIFIKGDEGPNRFGPDPLQSTLLHHDAQ